MANLEMNGPYLLTNDEIDKRVESGKIGNYALGYVKEKVFYVKYVGRSDNDLNKRLKEHLGENYSYFKYSYSSSIKNAFEKECKNYHDFGGADKLDNKIHPDKPENTSYKCPVCEY
ncbi:MAG: hypothetical protein VB048_11690 [Bacteroidaceae bacterium]|nr:hypothetical protein [Bacteroidaceae bacterium]MEA5099180.1 hypothetical protein [Bacteroidales bacterium]